MTEEESNIDGNLEAAEAAASKVGSRVHSVIGESSNRVVVEVVRAPTWRAAFLALLSIAILAGGFQVYNALKNQRQKTERKSSPPKRKVVEAIRLKPSNYQVEVTALASAKPSRTLVLSSQVSGRVKRVHPGLRPGGFVKEGEILFVLDDADVQNTISRLKAQIAQSRARKKSLKVQYAGSAKALKNARRALTLTKQQLQREESLLKKGHSTASRVDQARLTTNTQKERLDAAQTNKDALPGQIAQVSAEVQAAEASLEQARLELTRISVLAPFDAQVRQGSLEKDSLVQAGQALATLEAIGSLELAVAVPLEEVLWLTSLDGVTPSNRTEWSKRLVGRKAVVSQGAVDMGPSRSWDGVVSRIGPGLNERTRMLTLFVTVTKSIETSDEHLPLPLLPDMFCNVRIPGRMIENALVVPRKALQTPTEVFLAIGEKGELTLRRQRVDVAMVRGETAIITGGLEVGDQVITTALPKALPGMPIALRSEKSDSGVAAR